MWLAVSLALGTAVFAKGTDPDRQQAGIVARAVFAHGTLWLLDGDGELTRIDEGLRPTESRQGATLDLFLNDGSPTIVACGDNDCEDWIIRRWTGAAWRTTGSVRSKGDAFIAATAEDGGIVVLTSNRVIELVGDEERIEPLSRAIGRGEISSVLPNSGQLYIGLDAGEWGGGVERIDPSTGQVTSIKGDASGGLCWGPPDEGCQAVHDLAPEPWNPKCIVASIGYWTAEIVEVCGEQVRPLYTRQTGGGLVETKDGLMEFVTVRFSSLAASDGALLASTNSELYRIDAHENAQIYSLPRFATVGRIQVSFGSSRFVFVREFPDPQVPAIIVPR